MTSRGGRLWSALLACFALLAGPASARPVLMISIDGLRPADAAGRRDGRPLAPHLAALAAAGFSAAGVRNALPTVTYPNHTTLVTGVWPIRHGIESNLTFDPLRRNLKGWFWYASDIQAPTLWGAVRRAGGTTASLGWPATVGDGDIDANIPEYWRAYTPEDRKLERALSTPGLIEALEAKAGVRVDDMGDLSVAADEDKARAAAALVALRRPAFFTLHLSSLDETEHQHGPGSPEALEILRRVDAAVGRLIEAARAAEPDLVVMIVSDHGFAPIEHDVRIGRAFVEAGLIRLDAHGQPVGWDAAPWPSGGSAGVVLARRDDPALKARVEALLRRLASDPATGVARILSRAETARMGGGADMDAFIEARLGYEFSDSLEGPLVGPGAQKGSHGYFPDRPEMRATLIVSGPGVPAAAEGEVDMRRIAPTAAKILGVSLPSADLPALF